MGWPTKRSAACSCRGKPAGWKQMGTPVRWASAHRGSKTVVVDVVAVDRFRDQAQSRGPELLHRAPGLLHRQVHVVERDQRGELHPRRVLLAEVEDPVVPGAAQRHGVFGLQAVVAVERKGAEQHGHVQAFHVHGVELRDRVVVAGQGVPVVGSDLVEALLLGAPGRPEPGAAGPHRRAVGEGEAYLPVALARLAARDAVAPPGVHVLEVQVVGLEHVHVAVEHFEAVVRHEATPDPNPARPKPNLRHSGGSRNPAEEG